MTSIIFAALSYLMQIGFRMPMAILPLKGKTPATPHGWKDASTEEVQIKEWWKKMPNANIGIATGKINNILVIDVDINHAKGKCGDESLNELVKDLGELPPTWECITGSGGRHLYFKYPSGHEIRNSASKIAKDIDVRANGGYIVAPPSVHPETRKEYRWKTGASPENIELAELPAAWIERLEQAARTPAKGGKNMSKTGMGCNDPTKSIQKGQTNGNLFQYNPGPSGEFEMPAMIKQGTRNDTLFRYGASLRAKRVPATNILGKLQEKNRANCVPPVSDEELMRIYDSVMSYQEGSALDPNNTYDGHTPFTSNEKVSSSDVEKPEVEWPPQNLFPFHRSNKDGSVAGAHDFNIFKHIIDTEHIFILGKVPYIYMNGVYRSDKSEAWLKTRIKEHIFPEFIKSGTIERIYKLFLCDEKLEVHADQLNQYPSHWINFHNGFYDPIEQKMVEHDPKYFAVNQLPYDYDPARAQKGTVIKDWLESFIREPEDREMLLEYCGYCMTKDTRQQKFMIIYGSGGSGKSTLINLLEKSIGVENTSHVSLRELTQRFAVYGLMGKLLNACADLEATALEDTSTLKKILGEDTLRGEAKGKDAFNFRNYAKLIFSTNSLPLVNNERSNGFYRRLMILPIETTPKEAKTDFFQLLSENIDDFIHMCVKAVERMYQNGSIFESERSKRIVQQLREESDSVECWFQEACVKDSSNRELKTDLYLSYKRFCDETERSALQKSNFYRAMRDKGFKEQKSNGKRFFAGLRFKEKLVEELPF